MNDPDDYGKHYNDEGDYNHLWNNLIEVVSSLILTPQWRKVEKGELIFTRCHTANN